MTPQVPGSLSPLLCHSDRTEARLVDIQPINSVFSRRRKETDIPQFHANISRINIAAATSLYSVPQMEAKLVQISLTSSSTTALTKHFGEVDAERAAVLPQVPMT